MEKYNNYKDSGIEWLGIMPEHWEVKRIKDIFNQLGSGTTPKSSNKTYYENGNINWLNTTDLKNNVIYDTKLKITQKALNEVGLKVYPINSLAIAMYGQGKTRGSVGLLKVPTTTNQAACIMSKPIGVDTKFMLYWFVSKYTDIRSINVGATQPNMNQDFVKFLILQKPPLKEQTQIANYLDAKTTAIDKKTNLLQQKIKHYRAYRKTLINETVTKGLKNDNSNWVNCRLKDIGYLYSGLSGKSGNDFNQDDNPNNKGFIPFTNIANNTYLDENHLGTVVIAEKEKQNQVKKNDIFFLMSSEGYEDIGKSAVLIDDIKETYLNSFCKGFRITNKNCDASFINYLLLSDSYRQEMLVEGKGFTRINLKMEKVNNFSIAIPSTKKEQQQIVDYLDGKTTIINKITKNIEIQITTLKELRKTLINEVVTGKVKVSA